MDKIDMRKLTPETVYELKKQIIFHKEYGFTDLAVEGLTGVGRSTVNRIWNSYQKNGLKSLEHRTRGRKSGKQTLLKRYMQREVRNAIIEKTPELLELPYLLWTRDVICKYVGRMYGVTLSLRCMTNYMKRWGLACQHPLKRKDIQNPEHIKKWLNITFPEIKDDARKENAEIMWAWSQKLKSARFPHTNMLTAITNRGTSRFMFYHEPINEEILIEFMNRLINDSSRKVFLIFVNIQLFEAPAIIKWLEEHNEQIRLLRFPAWVQGNTEKYLGKPYIDILQEKGYYIEVYKINF